MSLRSALLGLLSAEPMSGYDLNRILDETFGYVWTAPHSQIYPTLRQMEREGLIEADVQRTGERERRVYRVLDAGSDYLRRWAAEPVVYSGERDSAHLKVSMMHLLSLDECEALFRAHLNYFRQRVVIWETRIEAIESGRSTILRARLKTTDPVDHAKLIAFKLCSYEGSVMRAKAEIEWAERGSRHRGVAPFERGLRRWGEGGGHCRASSGAEGDDYRNCRFNAVTRSRRCGWLRNSEEH